MENFLKCKKKKDKLRTLKVLSLSIVGVSLIYGIGVYRLDDRGTFGDMFGGLTALYSGLAFAGIIYTILLQRRELKLQRKELKQTKKEFKKQNQTLRKQRFENVFFNLVSQHNQIISSLEFSDQKTDVAKNSNQFDAFRFAHFLLQNMVIKELRKFNLEKRRPLDFDIELLPENELEEFLDSVIKPWYNSNPHDLHLYFQSLRTILRFVDKSSLLDDYSERLSYASLLKDLMSYYERAVILYVGLLPDRLYKGLTFYIVKYHILEGIDEGSLMSIRDKSLFYKWASRNEPGE